jgi:hypothetical protein
MIHGCEDESADRCKHLAKHIVWTSQTSLHELNETYPRAVAVRKEQALMMPESHSGGDESLSDSFFRRLIYIWFSFELEGTFVDFPTIRLVHDRTAEEARMASIASFSLMRSSAIRMVPLEDFSANSILIPL